MTLLLECWEGSFYAGRFTAAVALGRFGRTPAVLALSFLQGSVKNKARADPGRTLPKFRLRTVRRFRSHTVKPVPLPLISVLCRHLNESNTQAALSASKPRRLIGDGPQQRGPNSTASTEFRT